MCEPDPLSDGDGVWTKDADGTPIQIVVAQKVSPSQKARFTPSPATAPGLGAEAMRSRGYAQGWGLGRHVLGSNYFYYLRDPWGSWAEYSFGIDYVPADVDWHADDHPAEDSFYVWGPPPPDDFIVNHERRPFD